MDGVLSHFSEPWLTSNDESSTIEHDENSSEENSSSLVGDS